MTRNYSMEIEVKAKKIDCKFLTILHDSEGQVLEGKPAPELAGYQAVTEAARTCKPWQPIFTFPSVTHCSCSAWLSVYSLVSQNSPANPHLDKLLPLIEKNIRNQRGNTETYNDPVIVFLEGHTFVITQLDRGIFLFLYFEKELKRRDEAKEFAQSLSKSLRMMNFFDTFPPTKPEKQG